MERSFVKYLRGNVKFAMAILEPKGSIQYIRKITFIETISIKKHLNVTTFVLKGTFLDNSEQPRSSNTKGFFMWQ